MKILMSYLYHFLHNEDIEIFYHDSSKIIKRPNGKTANHFDSFKSNADIKEFVCITTSFFLLLTNELTKYNSLKIINYFSDM